LIKLGKTFTQLELPPYNVMLPEQAIISGEIRNSCVHSASAYSHMLLTSGRHAVGPALDTCHVFDKGGGGVGFGDEWELGTGLGTAGDSLKNGDGVGTVSGTDGEAAGNGGGDGDGTTQNNLLEEVSSCSWNVLADSVESESNSLLPIS
jgi:hypothetical protein